MKRGDLLIEHDEDGYTLARPDGGITLTEDDLRWLTSAAGPALLAEHGQGRWETGLPPRPVANKSSVDEGPLG